ncbi:2-(1,2-epoxy-1,2-dihydrophenyl)acetyl-CoA isomerase PaaG [soil metagenome]
MHYETILATTENAVTTITLNRPEVMNCLNAPMRAELLHALRLAPESARVIVLTGAGRAFCSGQDLGDRRSAGDVDLERTLREEYEPLLRAIYDCPVPTIAAVGGAAAGAGANLALACDVCIAAESAVFVQAFARIGLIPDAGGTYWLPRQVGFAKAMGAALFAEKISAHQAADWNMIWEAVPDEAFAATVRARALQLAQGPTVAYRLIKPALRQSYGRGIDEQLTLEARLQGEAGRTRDFQEGVMAFLEKRPARYEGR